MANNDATYVPILPSFDKFFSEMDKGARKGGKQAGGAFADAMGQEMQRTQRAVDRATGSYEKARDRATNAADKTRLAEVKLAEVIDKGDASASQLAKATNDLEKARRDQTRAENDAERASGQLTSAQEDLARASQESADALEGVGDSGAGIGDKIMGGLQKVTTGALLGIGAKIGTSILDGVTNAVQGGWEAALSMDTGQRVLEGLYDTAEQARDMMGMIRDVAADSPIDYVSYQKAAESLAYTGVQGEQAAKILENVGLAAVSAGKGDEAFESVNSALARMVNEGKVGRESLNQLSAAGVPILSGLAEHFGVSMEEVNKLITDGAVGFEDVLSVMENATGDYFQNALTAGEAASGSLENQMKMIKDNITTNVAAAIVPILQELEPVIKSLGEGIQSFSVWVRDNAQLVLGLASAVGGALAGFAAWRGYIVGMTAAQKAWNTINLLSTKGVKGLNAAMRANIIGIIVTAIAALVAGLAYFFTQTETGQAVWASFMDALSTAWEWLTNVFTPVFSWLGDVVSATWEGIKTGWDFLWTAISTAWNSVIQPVLSAFMTAGQLLFAVLATAVLAPLMLAWNALSAGIAWGWSNIIQPAWNALQAAAMWMWTNVLMPVFGWIQTGWSLLMQGIAWYWQNVTQPAWNALQLAAQWMWTNVLMPVFGFIRAGWETLSNAIVWAYQNVIQPAWNALQTALEFLWNSIISPIFGFIQDRWQQMAEGIRWVRDNIIQPVFDAFQTGLDVLKGWFETTVDAIGRTWDRVRELVAKPIRFVVETVFNNGIMKAWNAVVGFIGMEDKKLDPIDLGGLGAYASGGVLPGYTPGRDPYTFVEPRSGLSIGLSGGEAIMRPEWTRAVGGPAEVDRMNRAARAGRSDFHPHDKHAHEHAGKFADGGVLGMFAGGGIVGAMMDIVGQKYPQLTMTSGYRPGDGGMHGAGMAADFSNGSGNTPAQLALAHDIASTYPGSAELIYDAPGWSGNIKNGANVGAFGQFYTMAQAGPHHHHVHWAMTTPPTMPFGGGVFEGGSDGSGGGFFDILSALVKPAWDKVMDAIPDYEGIGWAAEVPGAFLKTAGGMMWDFVKDKAASIGAMFGGGGPGAEQWRGMLIEAFKFQGEDPLPARVDALIRQIDTESSGNPNIAQQIVDMNGTGASAGLGLTQAIPTTWQGYRDPRLPDDRTDPWAHLNFAVRYARRRHGWNLGPGGIGRGHGWAEGGVIPDIPSLSLHDEGGYLDPNTIGINKTHKPEPVFTAAQWRTIADSIWTSAQARQWEEMVDQMTEAAETFANGAHEIGRQFEADFARWQAGTHIQVSEDERLMTPDEMNAQATWWIGSELAEEVGGMFGLSSSFVGDLLGSAGFSDPGFDESALVKLDSQEVTAEQVNITASDVDAAPLPETGKEDGEPYLVIENVTVEGNATEEDGARFVRGAMEEARTRGRMARVN